MFSSTFSETKYALKAVNSLILKFHHTIYMTYCMQLSKRKLLLFSRKKHIEVIHDDEMKNEPHWQLFHS